ncbi:DUF4376 domain-containing protein [Bacillus spizizenii]|nr:DUF4376 domain-containing protein [Bacillus spizizenii]
MIIYIQLDDNNNVLGWSSTPDVNTIQYEINDDHEFLDSLPKYWTVSDGQLTKATEVELQIVRDSKIEELKNACNEAILAGFDYNGNHFQFNETDQANFTQQLTLLLLDSSVTEVTWKTENNGVITIPREEFIETCKAGESHKRNNTGHYWELKDYVNSLTSIEEIQKVNFNTNVGTNTDVNTEVV